MASTTIKMILMQILGLLIPFGGCAAVMSHILYRSKHPYKHPKVAKTIWITVTVLGAGLVIGMGVVMLQAMYGFTSKSRIRAANSNAKHVCDAFHASYYDLDEKVALPKHSETVYSGHFGDAAEENTLAWYMNKYGSDELYWVVVTDGKWNVQYALCSKKPITSDRIRIYTYDEQKQEMNNMFRDHSGLVGCYNYEVQRQAQHEFDRKQKLNEIKKRQEGTT